MNDDPQAVDDDYTLTSTANDIYALAVLANDVDVDGDTLTIDGAAADIGSVQITSEGLSFTAPEAYVSLWRFATPSVMVTRGVQVPK